MGTVSRDGPRALRVLYVTQDDLSNNSGYAFRVDRLRRAIEKAGAEVEVLGFSSGAPVIGCTALRSGSLLRRLWPLYQGLVRPADCVVITSIGAPYNGVYALLLRFLGKRVVYDLHDPVLYSLTELFGNGVLMRIAMRFIALSERLVDLAATATIASSPMGMELYKKGHWHGPLRLAYNIRGDTDDNAHEETSIREEFDWQESTIVVYVGGLQRSVRGLEQQIEAVIEARKRGADTVLLLVGFGDRAYFESLGRSLTCDSSLRVLENVPPRQLESVLRQCDVAISSEPIGYLMQSKYFDYLSSGVRIVAVDDDRDLIRTFGELVDRYDGTAAGLTGYLAGRPRRLADAQAMQARALISSLDGMSNESLSEIVRLLSDDR